MNQHLHLFDQIETAWRQTSSRAKAVRLRLWHGAPSRKELKALKAGFLTVLGLLSKSWEGLSPADRQRLGTQLAALLSYLDRAAVRKGLGGSSQGFVDRCCAVVLLDEAGEVFAVVVYRPDSLSTWAPLKTRRGATFALVAPLGVQHVPAAAWRIAGLPRRLGGSPREPGTRAVLSRSCPRWQEKIALGWTATRPDPFLRGIALGQAESWGEAGVQVKR